MMSASSLSASNTIEHAGSMISSRKAMWTGIMTRGISTPNSFGTNTGNSDMPAIGTCTARM